MNPIERATEALVNSPAHVAGQAFGVPLEAYESHAKAVAHAVLESIDTNELIATILRTELPGGLKVGHADKIALAVKNWLTGKVIQQ